MNKEDIIYKKLKMNGFYVRHTTNKDTCDY